MANMVANSLKGNATADSADPSDISIAANKFPARASTGNLEAKSISDFGLGLVAAADAAAGRTALGAAPTDSPVFTGSITTPLIKPASDSTTAIQLTKADGTTPVLTTDTTNTRIGIGKTPTEPLDVAGNIKGSGYLELSEIATPTAPVADTLRLYARDAAGTTKLSYIDNVGTIKTLGPELSNLDIIYNGGGFTAPGTWILENVFWRADQRFDVTTDGVSPVDKRFLFDMSHDYQNEIPAGGTGVITIDTSALYMFLYHYGYYCISYYYASNTTFDRPAKIKIRWNCRTSTSPLTYTWTNYTEYVPTSADGNMSKIYMAHQYAYPKTCEITIEATAEKKVSLSEIQFFPASRRASNNFPEAAVFDKSAYNTVVQPIYIRKDVSTLTGQITPLTGEGFFSILKTPLIKPVADSTTAIQLTKADGATPVMTLDTTNSKVGIKKTPAEELDVAGNIKGSGYLELSEISEPDAGAADTARIYAVANGSLTDIRVRANGEAGQRIALCGRENTFTKTQGFDIVNIGNSGTSKTIDWTAGNKQKMTLTGDCEVSFTDPSGSAPLELRLIQDTTGGRTVTWSGMTLKWEGGIAATLTAASNAIDIVEFTYDSGEDTYYGSCKNDFKAPA